MCITFHWYGDKFELLSGAAPKRHSPFLMEPPELSKVMNKLETNRVGNSAYLIAPMVMSIIEFSITKLSLLTITLRGNKWTLDNVLMGSSRLCFYRGLKFEGPKLYSFFIRKPKG